MVEDQKGDYLEYILIIALLFVDIVQNEAYEALMTSDVCVTFRDKRK